MVQGKEWADGPGLFAHAKQRAEDYARRRRAMFGSTQAEAEQARMDFEVGYWAAINEYAKRVA